MRTIGTYAVAESFRSRLCISYVEVDRKDAGSIGNKISSLTHSHTDREIYTLVQRVLNW